MTDKIVVIISSAEPEVAQTGMMYAVNALNHGWMEDVKIFFFGPAQDLLTKDTELQRLLSEFQEYEETAVACKFIADRDGSTDSTEALGVQVAYVGTLISDLIHRGYVPMVW